MSFSDKFINLGAPRKIWTVAAINGQRDRLAHLHARIAEGFMPGDRLVYTGNYFCAQSNAHPRAVLNDLLAFRRTLLARPGVMAEDIVFLRGVQEELWNKLQQVQIAQNPQQVIGWIQKSHPEIDILLQDFGTSLTEASLKAREGILNLTRWSTALKARIREDKGAERFFANLRRAAFTDQDGSNDNNTLIVHAGIKPDVPLTEQGDHLWWSNRAFAQMTSRFEPFRTLVRGSDPDGHGVQIGDITVSLDGGCGRGGQLVCAELQANGQVLDLLAV